MGTIVTVLTIASFVLATLLVAEAVVTADYRPVTDGVMIAAIAFQMQRDWGESYLLFTVFLVLKLVEWRKKR